ncbi:phage tail sheath family protein [Bacillus toyonensis]|uniref:phage tail sheath family protein n=1 Tax=Bacillus toyonensis TaxID=155322 RepID=UPI001C01C857|nr:phage tail sheath family protein [Bacillus toyonensis]QWH88417.1 phage tail sheath family protein [Bacillus toyonensis]QWI31592.1 phage tail sheath family protein [Bacillus toyonensis]
MPEYLSPGVYTEEVEIGAKPIEGVSTSTVGFLGETERGPTRPRLVTSFLEYQRVFGSYFGVDKYVPYAVQGFFDNGGQRCFISRIVKSDAQHAGFEHGALNIVAVGEGKWGNGIAFKITTPGTVGTGFKLSVFYWEQGMPESIFDPNEEPNKTPKPAISEVFDNLSTDNRSKDYYEKRINGISNLIKITAENQEEEPSAIDITPLEDGNDGDGNLTLSDYKRADTDKPGERRGLSAFTEIDEISIVYSPNAQVVQGLIDELITHCETLKDRFLIIDSPPNSNEIGNLDPRDPLKTGSRDTKYAAFYYPWIKVNNSKSGKLETIPPGGHIAGIYARTDTERGVHKAPANEVVRGAVDLEFQISKREQDILNPIGVNVIRFFRGRGIYIWGARTVSKDSLWKYINVRRLFNYLEESIEEGTQWVVFEPNDEKLWARVKLTLTEFLTRVWRDGALMGTKPEEAFFVKIDRTTMTQDDIDNGRLIALIGIAPVRPAEFVIFRIAQVPSGATITEA